MEKTHHKWSSAGGNVYQFSAAASDELANEYTRKRAGQYMYTGAATHAFCSAIRRHRSQWGSNIPYGSLLPCIEELQLDRRFKDQTPEFSSTLTCQAHPFSFLNDILKQDMHFF